MAVVLSLRCKFHRAIVANIIICDTHPFFVTLNCFVDVVGLSFLLTFWFIGYHLTIFEFMCCAFD